MFVYACSYVLCNQPMSSEVEHFAWTWPHAHALLRLSVSGGSEAKGATYMDPTDKPSRREPRLAEVVPKVDWCA